MNEDERAYRIRVIKIGITVLFICWLTAEWYCTQAVAEATGYHPLLGKNLEVGGYTLYLPFSYYLWQNDEMIKAAIPGLLGHYSSYPMFAVFAGVFLTYFLTKGMKPQTSHGSAAFATEKDIIKSDLGPHVTKNGGVFEYKKPVKKLFGIIPKKEKILKKSGVVIGIDPYTHRLMLHDGPEHILLMAPTRSGKGVNTIIPTGLIWAHSIFFFDPKGELWQNTSMYRQKYMHQKVLKFEPLCTDGSAARWNPFAEVNFRTFEEMSDVSSIVSIMAKPNGEKKGGGDPFWDNSAIALLNGVIMHLLYKYYKEKKHLPCPTDVMTFLSAGDRKAEFKKMRAYPHIHPEEFLELPMKDKKGNPMLDGNGQELHYTNPLKEIYGEYIKDFQPFVRYLGMKVRTLDEVRLAILYRIENSKEKDENGCAIFEVDDEERVIDFQDRPDVDIDDKDEEDNPLFLLLVHPKVAESAANMLNGADQTTASIVQTAQTSLAIYQDPVVQSNTAVSDFAIRDLLDPEKEVSLYFVMQVKDITTVKPIARLFINTMLDKLIRDMKFGEEAPKKKQRLLLMLDEFPQLGNMEKVETSLAICAGYGIKMCIVAQDVNQLNKEYTKDNSIASNCHVHVYFTPNLDSGGATAEAISKNLGKKTINTVSHSDGGGGLGKGSDSTSQTGRELMTPDEVSKMSSEKELVFVAGHRPIFGDKLRFYKYKMFTKRTACGYPPTSDIVTQVRSFDDLFRVHAADTAEREEKADKVLAAKAAREGISLVEYKAREQEEKEKREKAALEKIVNAQGSSGEEAEDAAEGARETDGEPDPQGTRDEGTGEVAEEKELKPAEQRYIEMLRRNRKRRDNPPAPKPSYHQEEDPYATADPFDEPEDTQGRIRPLPGSPQAATPGESGIQEIQGTIDSVMHAIDEEPDGVADESDEEFDPLKATFNRP